MDGKKSNGLIITLIIFIIITVVLGSFIIYDKTLNNQNKNDEINEKDLNKDESIENYYQVLELSPISGHAVLYNGEVYVNIYDSTSKINTVYGNDKFQTLIKTRESYKDYDFKNLKILTSSTLDSSSKWLKLNISKVDSIYNNNYGQSITPNNPKYGILMINEDKTVSYISIGDLILGNIQPTKLETSNISSIITEDNGGYTTYLISSDGNKTDVNTLIN